jgi:hypothetical protein
MIHRRNSCLAFLRPRAKKVNFDTNPCFFGLFNWLKDSCVFFLPLPGLIGRGGALAKIESGNRGGAAPGRAGRPDDKRGFAKRDYEGKM